MTNIIVHFLILTGALFILIASIGIFRFKDLYSRLHASTKAPSFGIFLIVIGVCIFFNEPLVYLKGLLIVLFIYLTAPLATHAIIKSFKDNNGKNSFSDED